VFTTIVWATDGSPSAENALPLAKGLARASGARLVVAHVEEVVIDRAGAPISADGEGLETVLRRDSAALEREGIRVEFRSTQAPAGSAAGAIVDLAKGMGAGLIVAGSRGRGPLAGLILGSVALRLLQTAPCPVLIVPERPGWPWSSHRSFGSVSATQLIAQGGWKS
jgi:nucleotide-binding universal stress UspA family protein